MNAAMSSPPRVTVIVPNYNHARFLEKRLSSIQQQTYRDMEVILLDDASTDESPELLKRYAGLPNSRLLLNRVNSGCVFKQWNRGIREARGEFVWIAESDDFAMPEFLERMVNCLDSHSEVGIAYCQSRIVDQEGNDFGVFTDFYKYLDDRRWRSDFISNGRKECERYHIFRNTIPNASAAVFRRSVYLAAGWADERMKLAGDWMQWTKMMMQSDVAFISDAMNFYRKHTGTVRAKTLNTPLALREFFKITAYIRRHVKVPADVRQTVNEQWSDMWQELGSLPFHLSLQDNLRLTWGAFCADLALVGQRFKLSLRRRLNK